MSKKDYKKGIADAMGAYEAFGEKQEAAIRHVGAEIEKTAGKVDKLGGKIGEIADYITDKEKATLYKLNTPVDIADLEDAEKRILLAVPAFGGRGRGDGGAAELCPGGTAVFKNLQSSDGNRPVGGGEH